MKKSAKSILLRVELKGKGPVNMDSSEQKFRYMPKKDGDGPIHPLWPGKNNNVNFHKKNFYKDGEKIKISENCIRYHMYRNSYVALNPTIMHHPGILCSMIASPELIGRGFAFVDSNMKRKSSYGISDAEQISNTISHLEFMSRSGYKQPANDPEKSDTTIFNKETFGEITYKANGFIDLDQLQFLSCDELYDRFGLNPDFFPLFKDVLKTRMPSFNSELKYYSLKYENSTSPYDSLNKIPEYGVLFNEKDIKHITKDILKRVFNLYIGKTSGYAATSKLEIKFVNNGLKDLVNDDNNGWQNIESVEEIEKLDFTPHIFYNEVDVKEYETLRDELKKSIDEASKKNKENKAQKAENKKGKKSNKNNDED